ncbi:hypothetical protein P5673_022465 [Acropora cervicornis]|uniref:Uncharacterized protein n=1 Tax=Acropora cervicornis TaxID=6130 RepID=A0AAD9Q6X1_ACRCE|nr:hypothetical protein P5673_022465 [Acropora cervicornis]
MEMASYFKRLSTHVAALDKVVYLNNRRFLPSTHALRKAKKIFKTGKAEHCPAPEKLHQEEVMVFPDMMHLMKNVTCEIVQLLTGYKDSFKIFDWCQFMNVKGELALHEHDQEKSCEAMQRQDPDDKSENSELEKGEFMVLRQSYVDHGISVPFPDDAVPSAQIVSCHSRHVWSILDCSSAGVLLSEAVFSASPSDSCSDEESSTAIFLLESVVFSTASLTLQIECASLFSWLQAESSTVEGTDTGSSLTDISSEGSMPITHSFNSWTSRP